MPHYSDSESVLKKAVKRDAIEKAGEDMPYRILLIDCDNTILDFTTAERNAIAKTFADFGIPCNEEILNIYHKYNIKHWELLESREETRKQCLENRFAETFAEIGAEADPEKVNRSYEIYLSQGHWFMPGAEETLALLNGKYDMYLISNGNLFVQEGRFKSSGITKYFKGVFVSEAVGADKPSPEFFEAVISSIPDWNREEVLVIGDSLTSDIKGGNNIGADTLWYDPEGKPLKEGYKVNYTVSSWDELWEILK